MKSSAAASGAKRGPPCVGIVHKMDNEAPLRDLLQMSIFLARRNRVADIPYS